MIEARIEGSFESWRSAARVMLAREVAPGELRWVDVGEPQAQLPWALNPAVASSVSPGVAITLTVPERFVEIARFVACHRDPGRWALLYRILWRITHGERELLRVPVDPDVIALESAHRLVRRDMHKMTAFVRFREAGEGYVAWYEPDHRIVREAAPFFARRFNGMKWSILTPDESAHWNGEELRFGPGMQKRDAPSGDRWEDAWRTYYGAIFNPARIKVAAMKRELPVRFWKNLPESSLIDQVLREAPARLERMYLSQPKSAREHVPSGASLRELSQAVQSCRACGICEQATQAVFGEGPSSAELMIVGEQPGDQEDRLGRPFTGPSGELLSRALAEAGLRREEIYVTNAVKHFKWKPQGKTRLHQRPAHSEVAACKPWLEAERELVRPRVILCLGVTSAQSVLGRSVVLRDVRGRWLEGAWSDRIFVTTHPSAILRAEPAAHAREYRGFVDDLRQVAGELRMNAAVGPRA